MRMLRFLLVLIMISGCGSTSRESSLENTIALFVSNGMKLTPELDREILRASNSVFSFNHLEEELNALKNLKDELSRICSNPQGEVFTSTQQLLAQHEIRNRAIALQIIAYQNKWPIEARHRFNKGDLNC